MYLWLFDCRSSFEAVFFFFSAERVLFLFFFPCTHRFNLSRLIKNVHFWLLHDTEQSPRMQKENKRFFLLFDSVRRSGEMKRHTHTKRSTVASVQNNYLINFSAHTTSASCVDL